VKPHRHAILYDVERWRKNRTILLFPAMVFVLVTIFSSTLRSNGSSTSLYSIVGAFLFALAASFWTRQRFSYLSVDGDNLVVRVMAGRQRIPLSEVRRAKVARLASKFARPEKRRYLPRPRNRWLDTDAVIIRLDSDAEDLVRLARLVGARCLDGNDLVVPVVDPERLVADIEEHRPVPVHAAGTAVAAKRSRRRR
jgi:hypothetical protein